MGTEHVFVIGTASKLRVRFGASISGSKFIDIPV